MNYFYNGKMPEQMNFKILYLNRFSQEMLYTHILHTHPFVELFYVLSGEGFFLKDEEKIAIKKGDLMVINPGTRHCEYSSVDNPLEFFVFAFTDIYFEKNDNKTEYILINEERGNKMMEDAGKLFEKIYQELCDEQDYYLNMIRNYFEQLIIEISREEGIYLIGNWNDYMLPFLYMDKYPTVALGIYEYKLLQTYRADRPMLFCGIIMSIVPVLILFACFSKTIMENTSLGGLKG